MREIILRLVGPIVLSSLGPIYYGYEGGPYFNVIIWALACTAIFSCWASETFRSAFYVGDAYWFRSALAGTTMAVVAVAFIAGNSLAYLLVLLISKR